jgi:uncharacterized membrane protein YqjE
MAGELQQRGKSTASSAARGALVSQRPAAAPAPVAAPPATTLLREAVGDAVDVLQAHVQLAVLEVREDAKVAGKIAAGFTAGGALAVLAIGFLGAGAAFGLALVVPQWAAFAIVGVVIAIAAAIVVTRTRDRLATHDFTPEGTIQMLEENRRWLGNRNDHPPE